MKKTIYLFTIIAVLSLTLPALAGGKGAVKTDLWQIHGPTDNQIVGSVMLNTNANGYLIAMINIDTVPDQGSDAVLPPLADYDVRIFINGVPQTFTDVLKTNAIGQGNATVKAVLGNYGENTEIMVNVVIRDFNGAGLAFYETQWNQVMVPLK